jgi:thioredoxin reductase (NADPH)
MAVIATEVLIIGGGPIGLACGLEAKKNGLDYVIIEKGCLVNSLYHYPLNMTFFSTSERLEIGGIPFVSNNAKPTRPEALEYYRRVAQSNALNIRLFEEVLSVERSEQNFTVTTSKAVYNAGHIIIATGFYDIPNLLHIPGEELHKVKHYYKDPHFYAGQKVVVVGAKNSAVDAALEIYRKGGEVTMVIREEKISDSVKYWVKPDVENRIRDKEITAWFNSSLSAITQTHVQLQTPEGPVTIENDFVLAMTGYQPNFTFLEKMGIQFAADEKRHPVYNKETQESNVKNIYLAGVVCGGMETNIWFIENSRVHAEVILQNIMKQKT